MRSPLPWAAQGGGSNPFICIRLKHVLPLPFPHCLMRILERSVYRGPHIFGATPMVRFQLDLEELEAFPTNKLPGFVDALLDAVPSLANHGCSKRNEGGFAQRL